MKANDIYKEIAEDVKFRSDTSNYEVLPNVKNSKEIELVGKIMIRFV